MDTGPVSDPCSSAGTDTAGKTAAAVAVATQTQYHCPVRQREPAADCFATCAYQLHRAVGQWTIAALTETTGQRNSGDKGREMCHRAVTEAAALRMCPADAG